MFSQPKNKPKQTQSVFLLLLQNLYIIYPLHSLPSIAGSFVALAKKDSEGGAIEGKTCLLGDYY